MTIPTYLTPAEVSTILKLSVRTVVDYANRGIIPGFRLGKHWRFKASDLECLTSTSEKTPNSISAELKRRKAMSVDVLTKLQKQRLERLRLVSLQAAPSPVRTRAKP